MGKLSNEPTEDEVTVFETRHHLFTFAGPVLLSSIIILGCIALLIFVHFPYSAAVFSAVTLVLLIAVGLRHLLKWRRYRLVLTNRRLIYHSGVFARRVHQIPLVSISDVSCHQNILDRMVGRGSLTVATRGDALYHTFFRLPHPAALQAEIAKRVDAAFREPSTNLEKTRAPVYYDDQPTQPMTPISVIPGGKEENP